MKRYRDPTGAIQPPDMPLRVKIICGIAWAVLIAGAVWFSVRIG